MLNHVLEIQGLKYNHLTIANLNFYDFYDLRLYLEISFGGCTSNYTQQTFYFEHNVFLYRKKALYRIYECKTKKQESSQPIHLQYL